jgi:hypothetical protein
MIISPSLLLMLKRFTVCDKTRQLSKLFSNPYWTVDSNEIRQSMVPAHVYVKAWQEENKSSN